MSAPTSDELLVAEDMYGAFRSVDPDTEVGEDFDDWEELTDTQKASWVRILRYMQIMLASNASDVTTLSATWTISQTADATGSTGYDVGALRTEGEWRRVRCMFHFDSPTDSGARVTSVRLVGGLAAPDIVGGVSGVAGAFTVSGEFNIVELSTDLVSLGSDSTYMVDVWHVFVDDESQPVVRASVTGMVNGAPAHTLVVSGEANENLIAQEEIALYLVVDWVAGASGNFSVQVDLSTTEMTIQPTHPRQGVV